MNVLSLFDGIACGYVALERAGILIHSYVASEIHPPSLTLSHLRHPSIIQVGDVRTYTPTHQPDLLIGGSPCTNFSTAGNGMGLEGVHSLTDYLTKKKLGVQFSGQSYLFWEYVRIWKETSPKWWLLENVAMKEEYKKLISDVLGCEPVVINSNLFSAQNRKRLYWTNIPIPALPSIKNAPTLTQILTPQPYAPDVSSALTVQRGMERLVRKLGYIPLRFNAYNACEVKEKAPTLSTGSMVTSSCATLVWDAGSEWMVEGGILRRQGVSYPTVLPDGKYNLRRLSIEEMELLQTLPTGYTEGISNSQREKAIGNGWTVGVITHILHGIT